MKGYKAFNKNWKCRDMQYEIGKSYEMDEKPIICQKGYHFCKNPIDVFGYYPLIDDTLIAEVDAYGDIEQEGTKFVTNKIRIVKEFTKKQLQALILDGIHNSGNDNSGHYNSGNGNSGHHNSGMFNSNEPTMRMFNKDSFIKYTDFINNLDYNWFVLLSHIRSKTLNDTDWEHIKALPNYDADIFYEITGLKEGVK